MAIDGTYFVVYASVDGPGFGVFRIDNGQLKGHDFWGGKYQGTAKVIDGKVTLDFHLDIGAGLGLVDGTPPQGLPYRRHIRHTFANFGNGVQEALPAEHGRPPVTVTMWRINDAFAPSADGFTITLPTR